MTLGFQETSRWEALSAILHGSPEPTTLSESAAPDTAETPAGLMLPPALTPPPDRTNGHKHPAMHLLTEAAPVPSALAPNNVFEVREQEEVAGSFFSRLSWERGGLSEEEGPRVSPVAQPSFDDAPEADTARGFFGYSVAWQERGGSPQPPGQTPEIPLNMARGDFQNFSAAATGQALHAARRAKGPAPSAIDELKPDPEGSAAHFFRNLAWNPTPNQEQDHE